MRKIFLFICIISAAVCLVSCMENASDHFPKGTSIDSVDISDLSYSDAAVKLKSYHDSIIDEIVYTISADDEKISFTATELGIYFDDSSLSYAADGGSFTSSLHLDREKAKKTLNSVRDKLSSSPVDAYAKYDGIGGFVFFDGKDGYVPDLDKLVDEIENSLSDAKSKTLTAKMTATHPKGISKEQLQENHTLISQFTTSFDKKPYNAENRVNNIKKAAKKINGVTIAPSKQFDTNKILGARNEENGWYKAPGIRHGKYSMEYGGGVCQVSTTLYNAALLANMQIVERQPHSWPVGYVDIGRDATISTDGPNFVFENNTQSDIIVSAVVNEENNTITVKLFGQKPKGYSDVKISSEQTGTISRPKTEYVLDTSLKKGEYVTDREGRSGKKAVTVRTFFDDKGNKIKSETVSEDTYRAFAEIIRYNA